MLILNNQILFERPECEALDISCSRPLRAVRYDTGDERCWRVLKLLVRDEVALLGAGQSDLLSEAEVGHENDAAQLEERLETVSTIAAQILMYEIESGLYGDDPGYPSTS
ncbi:MAG TPA: hypothetical protein VMB52_04910 [Verrucomicrobiae bacterium]|nr:hypothetical protein [Verrucomicrobiae bacterium]